MSTRATTVARQAFNIAAKHFCDCASPSDFPEGRTRRAFMSMLRALNKEWAELQRENQHQRNSVTETSADSATDPFVDVVGYRF